MGVNIALVGHPISIDVFVASIGNAVPIKIGVTLIGHTIRVAVREGLADIRRSIGVAV